MQTNRQSRIEVSADFGISLLINLLGQLVVYGPLATAGRSLGFAALVLGLAIPRRYATRRFFNAFVTPGERQTRWQSWFEIIIDTLLAIVIAIALQRLLYGASATFAKAGALTIALYIFTMLRRYAMRRLFESIHSRQNHVALDLSSSLSQ